MLLEEEGPSVVVVLALVGEELTGSSLGATLVELPLLPAERRGEGRLLVLPGG